MHGSQYLAQALRGPGKNGNKAKKGICSINSNVSVEGYLGFLFNRNCKISCLPSIKLKKKKSESLLSYMKKHKTSHLQQNHFH